jgi:uncharacterized protein (TIGR04255 family)
MTSKINIDLSEKFQHLSKAPIVEAVLEIKTRPTAPWEEQAITQRLKEELPEYPKIESGHDFKVEFKVKPGQPTGQNSHDLGWKGLKLTSSNNLHIAQFNRDSFVLSRLAPYDSWTQFSEESLRLWHLYIEIAKPEHIFRIGIRYINRIIIKDTSLKRIDTYINIKTKNPKGLEIPVVGFMHHNTYTVPGTQYAINIISTIQKQVTQEEEIGLIIDTDVFTIESAEIRKEEIDQYINEMRWLKNKAFFGSISKKTREILK